MGIGMKGTGGGKGCEYDKNTLYVWKRHNEPIIIPNQKYANKKKFEFRSSREWPGYSY